MNSVRLSLILPAYNEETSISGVVSGLVKVLQKHSNQFELIVVDNGSTDETRGVLKKLQEQMTELRVVEVMQNQGYGHGILEGFRASSGDVVGWCDADGQTMPDDIMHVYQCMENMGADFAKGCRYGRSDGFFRTLESRTFNQTFRFLFGIAVKDINGKPKFMQRNLYEKMQLTSKDWFIDAECILKAHKNGVEVLDVEIQSVPRRNGKSKIRVSSMFEFFKNLLGYKLRGY